MKRTTVTLLQVLVLWAAVVCTSRAADFATLNEAASAALNDAEALTPDFEAGGAIYLCLGRYAYLPPTTDHKRDHVSIATGSTAECQMAAMYHTHPKRDARFSLTDVQSTCEAATVSFIKPRGGKVRMFDCATLSTVAVRILVSGERPVTGKEI